MRWFLFNLAVILSVILSISPASGDEIHLTTGEMIKGTIIERTEESITVEHAFLGQVVIPLEKIEKVVETTGQMEPSAQLEGTTPAGVDIATSEPTEKEVEVEQAKVEEPEGAITKFLKEWNAGFEIGFNTSYGNNDSQNLYTAVNIKKETEQETSRLRFRYMFEKKDGDATRNEGDLSYWHDWRLDDSKWLYSALFRAEYDEFRSWDYRLTGNFGLGYRLRDEEKFETTLRAGLGGTKEFGSAEETFEPEGSLGFDLRWRINGWLSLETDATYLPNLQNTEDFRILASLDWIIKLDNRFNLKFGVDNEYNSLADPGDSLNDFKSYGALVVQY